MAQQVVTPAISRRQLLAATVALTAAAAAPRAASATPADADEMVAKLTGGAAAKSGRITLDMPQVAENGGSVPFTVKVDSPMTEADYVKAVHVVADGNPLPGVVSYHFTPASGKAEAQCRMRLAKTQKIRALAVMSDGSVYQAEREVKVTVGGCVG